MNAYPEDIRILITQGSRLEFGFMVSDAGGPLLGVTDGWTGRMEVRRSYGAPLLAAFADTTEAADGTLTIDDDGRLLLEMPATETALLPTTCDTRGQNQTYWIGGLELWRVSGPVGSPTETDPLTIPNPISVFVAREGVTA